jgi:hypothetical protein
MKAFASCGRARKHKSIIWQLNERKIDCGAVRYTCFDPQMLFPFGQEERNQIIIGRYRTLVTRPLRLLQT